VQEGDLFSSDCLRRSSLKVSLYVDFYQQRGRISSINPRASSTSVMSLDKILNERWFFSFCVPPLSLSLFHHLYDEAVKSWHVLSLTDSNRDKRSETFRVNVSAFYKLITPRALALSLSLFRVFRYGLVSVKTPHFPAVRDTVLRRSRRVALIYTRLLTSTSYKTGYPSTAILAAVRHNVLRPRYSGIINLGWEGEEGRGDGGEDALP